MGGGELRALMEDLIYLWQCFNFRYYKLQEVEQRAFSAQSYSEFGSSIISITKAIAALFKLHAFITDL